MLVVGLIKPSIFHKKEEDKQKFTRKKIGITLGLLTFILLVFAVMTTDTSQQNSSTPQSEQQTNEETANLSEKEQVELLVTQQLKGKNNLQKEYFREVRVTEQADGGWGVFAAFNAGDNLTTNLRKGGIEQKMSDIYIALYTSEHNIKQAAVVAYLPLVDQYGNEREDVVYKSSLDKVEADKVNWKADKATLQLQILPSVWTTTNLHKDFK